jgi:large subunit ribosomal protein L29
MMKPAQIRELSPDEMQARISELEEERFRLRFRGATEALDDPLRLRVIRRDIARLKTVLREEKTRQTKAGAARAGGR